MEEETRAPKVHENQLSLDVPKGSGATVGKWTGDDEFAAYSRAMGKEKALEQKRLAERMRCCNCGAQAEEEIAARKEARLPRRLSGHLHKPGCPEKRSLLKKTTPRLSSERQEARYREGRGT